METKRLLNGYHSLIALCILLLSSVCIFGGNPTSGDAPEANPYKIAAAADTNEIGAMPNYWDGNFLLEKIYEYLAEYGLKIIGAIVIFLIGRWLARLVANFVKKTLTRAKVDETLINFAGDMCYIVLLIFVIIATLGVLKVPIVQFSVIIGAAGLAIGLALQGSLANFASGVLMLLLKPFKVGDLVEAAGAKGTVKEIQIFNTIINTPDNVRVIIPNAQVTGGNIKNYTANGIRRVDLVVGVSYEDDLKKAKSIIEQTLAADQRVLKDPSPAVAVSELGDSSVNFVVRPWVKPADYWDVYFDITEKIKLDLDENGISIPYPQRDVHIKSDVDK